MKNKGSLIITILILVIFLMVSACFDAGVENPRYEFKIITSDIDRVIDKEAGVVCWVLSSGAYGKSINCMPISDTKLSN